nr:hypothetical protein [Ktedonobacterales bacterium]
GLGVAGFILVTAGSILRDAAGELLDTSLSPEQRQRIMDVVEAIPGVVRVPGIAGRTIGHTILVELHVDLDPKLTVGEGAHIVDAIKEGVLAGEDDVRTVVVEINTDQFEPAALHLMPPPSRAR